MKCSLQDKKKGAAKQMRTLKLLCRKPSHLHLLKKVLNEAQINREHRTSNKRGSLFSKRKLQNKKY